MGRREGNGAMGQRGNGRTGPDPNTPILHHSMTPSLAPEEAEMDTTLSPAFTDALARIARHCDGRVGIGERLELLLALDLFDRLFHEGEGTPGGSITRHMVLRHDWTQHAAMQVEWVWAVV